MPDHASFPKKPHGRFCEIELLRRLFEATVARCIEQGPASGQRMAIDASPIEEDASKQSSTPKEDRDASLIDPADAVRAYPDTQDEAAFGAACEVQPKVTSHSDPASQCTAAREGPAFFVFPDNDLIETDHGVIVDVDAGRSIRQAEVGSTRTVPNRVTAKLDLNPERLIADTAHCTGSVTERRFEPKIAPRVPVLGPSGRSDGTSTRTDWGWGAGDDRYIRPDGNELQPFRRTGPARTGGRPPRAPPGTAA